METESKNQVSNGVLILLVLVALVLAYFWYQKISNNAGTSPESPKVENSAPPSAGTPDNTIGSFTFAPLSDDERAVLNPPSNDAPQKDQVAHFALVEKVAIETGDLAIGSACKVSPVVLKTKMGKNLKLRNYDSIPHTIAMPNEKLSFPVPANGSITIPVNFGKRLGTYGYICDQSALAGIILVTE